MDMIKYLSPICLRLFYSVISEQFWVAPYECIDNNLLCCYWCISELNILNAKKCLFKNSAV